MRVCWRVDHHGVHDIEVDLQPDSTVGEVAAELLGRLGADGPRQPSGHPAARPTRVHEGRPLARSARVAAVGPPSGATVALAEGATEEVIAAPPAPARLLTRTGEVALTYGPNGVTDGVVVEVGSQVTARVEGTARLTVDGAPVRGNAPLPDGALLRSGAWTATIAVTGSLRPPAGLDGPARSMPLTRGGWAPHEPDPVELPPPPPRSRRPGFPWLSALIPLLMGAALWVATGSLLSMAFMAFSFAYVVAAGVEGRREARAEDRFRVQEFRAELQEAEGDLGRRREAEEHRDEMRHPAVAELLTWFDPVGHRVWERPHTHPHPLVVRLGTAERGPDDPVVAPTSGRPELREEAQAVAGRFASRARPVNVDLAATGLAIIGDDHLTVPLARSLVFQVAALVPPDAVALHPASPGGAWHWLEWLPHRHSRATTRVTVVPRHDRAAETAGDHPGCLVWVAPDTVGMPEHIGAVVHFDATGQATLQLGHGEEASFSAEHVPLSAIEPAARRMSSLTPGLPWGEGAGAPGAELPDSVALRDLGLGLTAERVTAQWATRRDGLAAPIGRAAGGGVMSLDLVADGPHALVAGTTGSGKSELLRTMLASLASMHPPTRLNLLLVDYKGGAAFGPLAGLPHCVGLVTDLSPAAVRRALAALRAELRRRERVLDRHGASSLAELDAAACPPALMVVIDEFATLVAEVPAFLDGVLDIAQRGRSLGIHMVLATQRPSGVISDAVRANTSLRIALRLPDADDSSDVVDDPGASALPRGLPGRALLRLGPDTLVTAQVAWGGAPADEARAVHVRPLGSRAPRRPTVAGAAPLGGTQLDAVVAAACGAAAHLGLPAPRPPWAEPLPEVLAFEGLPTEEGRLILGMVDLPNRQTRVPLSFAPHRHGGLLAVGAAAAGTSSTLVALAAAADAAGGWVVHAIDTGGSLGALAGLRSVESVVRGPDHEAVHRLLDTLVARVDAASVADTDTRDTVTRDTDTGGTGGCAVTPGEHARRVLLLLDGFGAFEEQQRGVNRGVAVDRLVRLAVEGRAAGITVAVAARRRSELPPLLTHALGERLLHRCVDADEAAHWDAPAELADADLPPGRVWRRGDWAQVAKVGRRPGAPAPPRPARLGRRLHLDGLPPTDGPAPWVLAVGLRADDLTSATLDLRRGHVIVAGPPRSGRTTALAAVVGAGRPRGLRALGTGDDPRPVLRALLGEAEALGPEPDSTMAPTLVALDDIDEWIDEPEVDELLGAVIRLARRHPVRLAVAGEAWRLQRCFSDPINRLRSARQGVLLGADAAEYGELLHAQLRRRDDIPAAPGRGWLVADGEAVATQLALPRPTPVA